MTVKQFHFRRLVMRNWVRSALWRMDRLTALQILWFNQPKQYHK